jgi:hypothetical protein
VVIAPETQAIASGEEIRWWLKSSLRGVAAGWNLADYRGDQRHRQVKARRDASRASSQ